MAGRFHKESSPLVLSGSKSYGSIYCYYNMLKNAAAHSFQTLSHGDSMVSLCFRSLSGFVQDDNLQGLQAFLENKQVQVDDRDENGGTALMLAAAKGRLPFVRELLAHGADPNAQDGDDWTALLCAAKEGHTDICGLLLEHGADLEHREMGGWTALMWSVYKGHVQTTTLLLDNNADVNAHGNFHISSLLWAAGRGHTPIVQELVRRGAKVNVGDKYGTTALVWACRKGYTEIVDCLLQAGANVDTAGMYSWTPLLVATQGNHVDVVNLLLEQRPNVNALDKDGCTALMIACKEGYYEIATSVMNSGAYINIQDRAGDTNLIHAVKGGHRGIVEALLKKYADVDVCGKDRKTAIYTAVEKGNVGIVRLLLSANPDLEIATKDGDTPLLRAVRSRNAEIVQLLLDKRAKVSATDKKGDTALHIAMRARSKAIIEILLRNPKNSQLLYRPNKQGETAYNIDLNHQKQILGQVFGARRLNTNEDNENMLGYDLYSSALADMLSEPSLSMPITVGLYAKWGSGKSFLLNKLREEMKNFARQWVDPVFHFSWLLFLIIVHISCLLGTIIGISLFSWIIGVAVGGSFFILSYILLAILWHFNNKYDWDWPYTVTTNISRKLNSMKLILQILFCHPPVYNSTDAAATAQPIRFYFTDQTRVSSTTVGENSVVQMIGSLYDAIESNYGSFSTRLYRAFKPKPAKSSTTWKFRRMCCLPYVVIFEICFICLLILICVVPLHIKYKIPTLSELSTDAPTTIYESNNNSAARAVDKPTQVNNGLALTINLLILIVSLILGIMLVANLYTLGRMCAALFFSQRRHLQRAIAKLDTLKSEGFQQTLNKEVGLMKDMVKCLDSLSSQQTRLVVIVDGLDSCEQDKVLLVLDAVHMLFSETNTPFIVILAIDPHVISKAVEMNSRRLFNESNIGGHDYLRNLVHLPFFLQNSGLRKVRVAQQTAQLFRKNNQSGWADTDDNIGYSTSGVIGRSMSNRRLSQESVIMSSNEKLKPPPARKGSKKLRMSDSIASSIGSNLNMVVGAHDLTKMLLTDDYFSDVNPRSMRRLMNVVYVTGRLLKAFQIDFNWYHLASWINITEQWPFRTSWIILHFDMFEDTLDDNISLKTLYDKIRPKIPTIKEQEPLLELDRDEKKFDIFLSFHRSSLLVSDLKIFLPFTINLDPYIKKVIKEEHHGDEPSMYGGGPMKTVTTPQWAGTPEWGMPPKSSLSQIRHRPFSRSNYNQMATAPTQIIYGQPHPNAWPTHQVLPVQQFAPQYPLAAVTTLPPELFENKLSTLNVKGICSLLEKIDDLTPNALAKYTSAVEKNNINGRVLLHCDLDELKSVLKMSFGDWEMFRVVIVSLREHELTSVVRQDEASKNVRFVDTTPLGRERKGSLSKDKEMSVDKLRKSGSKQSIMEKQVTLEDQMICGALQTLNEEACEDVLEETVEEIPQTSLIPPSPTDPTSTSDIIVSGTRSRTSSMGNETDFVILTKQINQLHWQPSITVSSGGHSENSSACSTPASIRKYNKEDLTHYIDHTDSKKSTENYIMVDIKKSESKNKLTDPLPPKEVNRTTENIHSSMYGQNRKHNSINKPISAKFNNTINKPEKNLKSLSLDHTNVNRNNDGIPRTNSAKNITKLNVQKGRSRPCSLLVTRDDGTFTRSNSEEGKRNNSVLSSIKTKFTDNISPATSCEKLTRLKEKLINAGVGSEDSNNRNKHNLDSDDESTPLVSDISTPSLSVGHNSAFSPSDKGSSPEDEKNKTNSTEYSPVPQSPQGTATTVSVSTVCNVLGNYGAQIVSEQSNIPDNVSDVSLSYYLEAQNKFSNSSLASMASIGSDPRSFSNSSGISRQNALDPEDLKDLDND